MLLVIIVICLVALLAALGACYAMLLHVTNQLKEEKERFQKGSELLQARTKEHIARVEAEAIRAVTKANEQIDQAQAKGKQEGKRDVLSWIKQSVDEGTLEVRVVGEPKIDVVSTPKQAVNPFYQPSTQGQ